MEYASGPTPRFSRRPSEARPVGCNRLLYPAHADFRSDGWLIPSTTSTGLRSYGFTPSKQATLNPNCQGLDRL